VQLLAVQIAVFRELVNVRYNHRKFTEISLFRTMQWGWFFSALTYSYGHTLNERISIVQSTLLLKMLPYVEVFSLLLYSGMLIATVLSFRHGYYKYQMGQLAWTIAIIVIIVVQVNSISANILNGLFWFLFPVSLVICNDSMAYFCGMAWGRKLIKRPFLGKLSPNKTWEGFIFGGLCTVLFAFCEARIMGSMNFLVCPCDDLRFVGEKIFELDCELPKVFVAQPYPLPALLSRLTGWASVTLLPVQFHALWIGLFASVVAPFGGFFASGIKRAYKLDDFASLIPGHGGVFDRVDCQLITGLAMGIYYSTFIMGRRYSPGRLMQIASSMPQEEQLDLYRQLGAALKARGALRGIW
jgi:phosphatidate cytidylyltransferase